MGASDATNRIMLECSPAVSELGMDPTLSLRQLSIADSASYRGLRLDGLRRYPEAFGAAWLDEAEKPLSWFATRLRDNRVFGGFVGHSLVGVAGLSVPDNARLQHKGALWGMYVQPEARRAGVAAALVQRVINETVGKLEELLLTFTASNIAAEKLYYRFGFQQYGIEPRAFKIGHVYHDMVLMRLPLSIHSKCA